MWQFVARRLLGFPLTLLAVGVAVYLLLLVVPGDPARLIVGPEATEEAYQQVRLKLGLDAPWPLRLARWLGGVVRGDLGRSLASDLPVGGLVGRALALTLPLALLALGFALVVGLPLGTVAALRPGSWLDLATVGFLQLGQAIPGFWLGIFLIEILSVRLGWLPAGGFPGWEAGGEALAHLVLPAVALGLPWGAYLARMARAALAEVLSAPYIRTARGKGLPEGQVVLRHAFRPALVPLLTAAGLTLGRLVAGAIVIEHLFGLPGLGQLALGAVRARDLPLLSGSALTVAGLVAGVSLVVDLLYGALDPRVRYR